MPSRKRCSFFRLRRHVSDSRIGEGNPVLRRPAMPIHVACACGKSFDVREEFAGRQLGCSCGRVLIVPALPPLPPPPPPPIPTSFTPSAPPRREAGGSLAP